MGQEPVLFARSIRENIAYGVDTCSIAQVEEAAKMANAHNFISDMKDKYDTEAGEKGAQLSGKKIIGEVIFLKEIGNQMVMGEFIFQGL